MKRFKEYINMKKEHQPVFLNMHGAHSKPKSDDTPVFLNMHGAHSKPKHPVNENIDDNENSHLGSDRNSIMDKLHELHPLDEHQKDVVRKYTTDSRALNTALVQAHKDNKPVPEKVLDQDVKALDDAFTPSKTKFHTYSGLGFNPKKLKSVGNTVDGNPVIHSPAYLSSTHHLSTAAAFADDNHAYHNEKHPQILHIEHNPGDKVLIAGRHSAYDREHETTIPRDQHFEYLGSHIKNVGDQPYEIHRVRRINPQQVIKT